MSKCKSGPSAPACRCCRTIGVHVDVKVFKALSDPTRVAILGRMGRSNRPCTVSEIACCTPIDVSVVSRHLHLLRDAGLVTAERVGKEVRYALDCEAIGTSLREVAEAFEGCCGAEALEAVRPCARRKLNQKGTKR